MKGQIKDKTKDQDVKIRPIQIRKEIMIMKKTVKGIVTLVLSLVLVLSCALPASAAERSASATVKTEAGRKSIKVKKLTYDLKDHDENISIDFSTKLRWKRSADVTVKDQNGTSYDAWLEDTDSDECDIYVEDLKSGKTYTLVLSGVKSRTDSAYGKVTVTFSIPSSSSVSKTSLAVDEIEYDYDDSEISIDFINKIRLSKDASVIVKDSDGRTYDAEITDYDSDEVEITVWDDLKYGNTYTVEIKGIKAKSASSYTAFSKSFRAIDD